MRFIIRPLLLFLALLPMLSIGQNKHIDSLKVLLNKDQDDTLKLQHLNSISREFLGIGLFDTAIYYGNQSLELASALLNSEDGKKIPVYRSIRKNIASSYNNLGVIYFNKGEPFKTLELFEKSLKIAAQLQDYNAIARQLGNIGNVYNHQGDYPKALDYYLAALRMSEKTGDKNGIARHLGNIGIIYNEQSDYKKALDFYMRSLQIATELADSGAIARHYGNIGLTLKYSGDTVNSFKYYFKALGMEERAGNLSGVSRVLNNIGSAYADMGKHTADPRKRNVLLIKALDYYTNSLKIDESLGDLNSISIRLINIGGMYTSLKRFKDAYSTLLKATRLADSLQIKDRNKEILKFHYELYSLSDISLPDSAGKPLNPEQMRLYALQYYERYIDLRDKLFNEENKQQLVRKEMNFDFERKSLAVKTAHEKDIAVAEADKKRQQWIIAFVSCGLLLVFLLAGLIFRSLKITRAQKAIIEEQKRIVEEKQKDILASISYAKRIQEAILIPEKEIKEAFSDAFVLFRPKDIVSGDFYWFAESKFNKIVAIADCTGHGVPGGFMSMLGYEILQEILLLENVETTSEALKLLDQKVTETLNKSSRTHRDGMDMALCAFSKHGNKLQFSGANRPLLIVRKGELTELSPDKHTIGGSIDETDKRFSLQELEVFPGDLIYLFTDGYADQFGGPEGKKYKSKNLKELIRRISSVGPDEQKLILESTFDNWRGDLEQVDDVSLICLRI